MDFLLSQRSAYQHKIVSMQPKFTLKKSGVFYFLTPLFIALFSLFAGNTNAQTVSTASGTNFNGDYSIYD